MPDTVFWRTDNIRQSMEDYKRKPHSPKKTIQLMIDRGSILVEQFLAAKKT